MSLGIIIPVTAFLKIKGVTVLGILAGIIAE